VEVELWDTVGLERFNEECLYSEKYLQGKHGVMLVVDGSQYGT